jgi:hypothetical protein
VTYNRPSDNHHLASVRIRCDETLQEYTNCYFENRNTLAGVKDEDVIAYYKKGITNIKLFEKIHEADAHTIGDLLAYVDKLVDTQDAVMHDFNGEDHDDRSTRSRKQSGKPMWRTHQDLPLSSKVTSTWSWTTSANYNATLSTP